MELDPDLNRSSGCPLSFHKSHVDPLGIVAESVEFGQYPLKSNVSTSN